MVSQQVTDPALIAFHELVSLAFFFAMRSCEYLKVTAKSEERRTRPICLRNLQFRRNNKEISHDDPNLETADTITITFEYQKADRRNQSVTQSRSENPVLCPVKAAAAAVRRLAKIKGTTLNTPLYTYADSKRKTKELTGNVGLSLLRAYIRTIDPALGILWHEVGLHSIRSSSAMAMVLNNIPELVIQKLGRWSSNAFLRYIRKQVVELSNDVSRRMVQNKIYYHVNNSDETANSVMGASEAAFNIGSFSVW